MPGKRATAKDAELLLQLYDLRREPVLRTARKYLVTEFWPATFDDFSAVLNAFGTDQNAWLRQGLTYWDMAAALVLQGALNEELFYQANLEPYFLYVKYGAFLPQVRKEFINPEFLINLEKLAQRPRAKDRVKQIATRLAARRAAAAAAKR